MDSLRDIYKRRRSEAVFAVIFIATVFVRAMFVFWKDIPALPDSVVYAKMGKYFLETGKLSVFGDSADILFHPGYPIAFGIADHFFNNTIFSLRFVSFVFGCLLVYMFYIAGKEMSGKRAGLFAAFFGATNSSLILYSQEVISESMFFFFMLLSFYFYLRLDKDNKVITAVFLGLSIGISYLIRPEGLLLLIFPLIFLFNILKNFRLKILLCFLSAVISAMVIMAPYVYFISKSSGQVVLTGKTSANLVAGHIFNGLEMSRLGRDAVRSFEAKEAFYNKETNSLDYSKERFANINVIAAILDPSFSSRYLNGLSSETYVLFTDHWLGVIVISIISAILYSLKNKHGRKNIAVLACMPLILFFMFPIFHIESRYLVQVFIFLILIASLDFAAEDIPGVKRSGIVFSMQKCFGAVRPIVLVVILLQFIVFIHLSFFAHNEGVLCKSIFCFNLNVRERYFPPEERSLAFEYEIAGEYIKRDMHGSDAVIMAGRPTLASFYAGVDNIGVKLPDTDPENIIKFAKANRVGYIVLDKRYLSMRKNFEEIFALAQYSKDLSLVFEDYTIEPIKVLKLDN